MHSQIVFLYEQGLSSLARGNRSQESANPSEKGSIPARAGEPYAAEWTLDSQRVYPRSRGGTIHPDTPPEPHKGLSPLARGNRHIGNLRWFDQGLSPLARGNLQFLLFRHRCQGSIPARAGEPVVVFQISKRVGGLSPLARGNQGRERHLRVQRGSIPARAGEPARELLHQLLAQGLSPLARGNRVYLPDLDVIGGSIPARAGEPSRRLERSRGAWVYPRSRGEPMATIEPLDSKRVYPRSRGGTSPTHFIWGRGRGLSPLARGNPRLDRAQVAVGGSIPARAGEPSSRRSKTYWHGSIPARAGEPLVDTGRRGYCRVYPRSRGGTWRPDKGGEFGMGLSPLARGNQRDALERIVAPGSIPARAGEPLRDISVSTTVPPRERG